MTEFTRAEIETGRKLFAGDWKFVAAAGSPASLPPMMVLGCAVAGRSNVGKFRLMHARTWRKSLARNYRTPCRTEDLIFVSCVNNLNFVEMPGCGYAAAAKTRIAAWTDLIEAFLRG